MKKLITLLLALIMAFSFAACAAPAPEESTAPAESADTAQDDAPEEETPAEVVTWKFSSLGNEELGQSKGILEMERVLEELSGGTIDLEVYLNGTLYNQSAATDAVLAGDLEFNISTFGFLGTLYAPANMFAKAYNFNDYDHYVSFIQSDLYDEFVASVDESSGVHVVSMWYNGARTLNPVWEEPVMTPADLEGKILRTPNNPGMINMGEALGATVSPIDFGELYTALQTGTVDAEENSLSQIQNGNFHEVTSQITLTNHQIEILPIIVPIDLWNSMTDEQKGWVEEAAEAGRLVCDEDNLTQESNLVSWFEEQGMVIVEPDLQAFQDYAATYYEENDLMAEWDMDLYEALAALG